MPYSYPNDLPSWAKNLPAGAQKIAVKVFNAVLEETGSEDKARQAAWKNIKDKYKKSGDEWVKKTFSVHLDEACENYDDLPDDVLELPGKMPIVWQKVFNKLIQKNMSVPLARREAWGIVKKYVFQNKNNRWCFKKLDAPELILHKSVNKVAKMQVFTKSLSNGKALFKMFIPFDSEKLLKSIEKDGIKFLKGVASGAKVDREDDQIDQRFVEKMKKSAVGLPVFVDHKHDNDHLIGSISSVEEVEDFVPVTELEPEDENQYVRKVLRRIAKIKGYGYSVGGEITKAVKVWDESLGRFIRKILDGNIYEVSVVPIPAYGDAVQGIQLVTKNLDFFSVDKLSEDDKDFFKSFDFDFNDGDNIIDEDDGFWLDFEKAVDKIGEAHDQPNISEINIDSLPDECFLTKDKKYPIKYPKDKQNIVYHYDLLDKAFHKAHKNNDSDAIEKLTKIREELSVSEREFEFVDFRKLLSGTLSGALEARDAREKMYEIVPLYQNLVWDIVYSDASAEEKRNDLMKLSEQLSNELEELSQKISQDVIITVKSLNLDMRK